MESQLESQYSNDLHNTSSHYDDENEHEHDDEEHEQEDNEMQDDEEHEEDENPEYSEDYGDDNDKDNDNEDDGNDCDQETLNNTLLNSTTATEVDITNQLQLNKKISSKDFEALSILGKGGFGTVALVKKVSRENRNFETDEGELYAMKIVKKVSVVLSKKDTDHTKSERNILQKSDHPFIVKLIYAFQNKANLYLVLEFVRGGELFMLLEKETTFDEEWSRFYLAEIALALGYLHENNVIYRDLKPENVLLAHDGHVKLTDFGLCKENITSSEYALTLCGTIEYMAPEILKKRGHNKEVDWWSMGILMWDMINCSPPFQGRDREETEKLIQRARPPFQMSYGLGSLFYFVFIDEPI